MDLERDASTRGSTDTPAWRDPLAMSFRAHRQVMLMRLRWHERAATRPSNLRSRRRP